LEEAGIPFSEDLVVWGGYRMEGGRKACAKLLSLSDPPTAIFSTNNLMTVGVLQELSHRGIKIPEEVAVVGFDDLEWAEIVYPPLTTVAQRPYEIGRTAFNLLLERLQSKEKHGYKEVRIAVELKVRESANGQHGEGSAAYPYSK
jgi:LacI family transcriptional regulator